VTKLVTVDFDLIKPCKEELNLDDDNNGNDNNSNDNFAPV
jgi:hypothetical protein